MIRLISFLFLLALSKEFIFLNEEILVILSFLTVVTVAFVVGGDSLRKALDAEVLAILVSLRDSFSAAKGSLLLQKKEILSVLGVIAIIPSFAFASVVSAGTVEKYINEDVSVYDDAVSFQLAGSVLDAITHSYTVEQASDLALGAVSTTPDAALVVRNKLSFVLPLPEGLSFDEDVEIIVALNCVALLGNA